MRVLHADALGLCFGVRDALDLARRQREPDRVTIWGELVHNEQVLGELRARGYRTTAEDDRGSVPDTPRVLITAHGISRRERRRLESHGKQLIDTTCPLVAQVQHAARELEREGCHVVVIGVPGHVEVLGIVGDLARWDVVRSARAVRDYGAPKVGVVCQTTFPQHQARAILAAIRDRNPGAEVRFVDTICAPTRRRIAALEDLLPRVDAVVVVGGAHSNNTRHLVALCESRGMPAFHVQGPDDLDVGQLSRHETVGLAAGTSTPDRTIHAVHRALRAIRPMQ